MVLVGSYLTIPPPSFPPMAGLASDCGYINPSHLRLYGVVVLEYCHYITGSKVASTKSL